MTNVKKLLKMKELAQATGVSRGTIQYYIQKGLLPKPVKTHRNMAYYGEGYIERIRMIKELQTKRFLPLEVIKDIIDNTPFLSEEDLNEYLKIIDRPMDQNGFQATEVESMTKAEMVASFDVTLEEVEWAESLDMISADEDGRYDKECIRMVALCGELRKAGLSAEMGFGVENLRVHVDLLEFMARKEVEIISKGVYGKGMNKKDISHLVQNALTVINKLIPLIHTRMIRKIFEENA